jgi:ribosomal protein S18 acetylase RimI-like enzyme
MVGNDGHRGWMYYLVVRATERRSGIGTELVRSGEQWLGRGGVVKTQLMVRHENFAVLNFYEAIGYKENDVKVLSRWLDA